MRLLPRFRKKKPELPPPPATKADMEQMEQRVGDRIRALEPISRLKLTRRQKRILLERKLEARAKRGR